MPNWLLPLLGGLALSAFILFAFRQGTKVPSDRNNSLFGPSTNSDWSDGHS